MSSNNHYSNKAVSQRERRAERRRAATSALLNTSSSDSDDDQSESQHSNTINNLAGTHISDDNDLLDYDPDGNDNVNNDSFYQDDSSTLFINSSYTVRAATIKIVNFAIDVNLDKIHTTKLLRLIKLLLPQPNVLPTSHKGVLKVFNRTSGFTTKYLCEHCGHNIIVREGGVKQCSNACCSRYSRNILNNRISEVVTMNIREGLHFIIKRNIKLLFTNKNLFPTGDIVNFKYYSNNSKISEKRTLTLILHADGAPLVRSTRQSLWPLFANIIEIPPPARDHQRNILILGEYNNTDRVMLYPYENINNTPRTHHGFQQDAQLAAFENERATCEVIVNGVRGVSPLLSIMTYPVCILYDYMHLVCINHFGMLAKRWNLFLTLNDRLLIDNRLSKQRLPHNMNIRFDFSIRQAFHWKAKHGRMFILYIGLPILIDILPAPKLFHFAVYALAIKLLHKPENDSEIDLAEKLLNFYCQSSSLIYDATIELYSLHAHRHLAEQVRYHGGLSYTSAFAFESCIRYTKKKAHGTRNLASQISFWTDMNTMISQSQSTIDKQHGVDEILLENCLLDEFRSKLIELLGTQNVKLYKRFKIPFITFHSTLYDKSFKCVSHIISYKHDSDDRILYGDCIVFMEIDDGYYVFLNQYQEATLNNRLSSLLGVSDNDTCKISKPLDRFYSMQGKSDRFGILSMSRVRHKCISVPVKNYFCVTEIRNDFEHD
ncbi:unnamed protein product [Adineta steineri]|uniref:Uncharacterized protein n=1 Tax=Adineta steineri TaxID=433720 RepID=A0A815MCS8_9BILA|nr:unnamed protein product [Adineta steineri]CAF1416415.1 unnamed protein product [Adineta steineri]CAF4014968.1 unnamed protein product [Adineta steineri]CAF4052320.1 unnamed protein product [Adineta steineri]